MTLPELLRLDVDGLTPEQAAVKLIEAVQVVELLRLRALARPPAELAAEPDGGEPWTLSPDDAAALAGVTRERLVRAKVFAPAKVRLGHRSVAFDARRLRQILARRTGG
jgi:hypothetical protein